MEAIIAMHRHGRRVRMTGRLPMEEILRLMEESDVFLYPSFHHGLATVVLQAMLTGVPIVCLEGDATGRAVRQEAGITVALDMQHQPAADLADAVEAVGGHWPAPRNGWRGNNTAMPHSPANSNKPTGRSGTANDKQCNSLSSISADYGRRLLLQCRKHNRRNAAVASRTDPCAERNPCDRRRVDGSFC
jgi:hypothetical protein